ncbi:MAG TPA: choice-of-anchor D domain-containing protein, partial [Acidobacteriaceae bacterium]|nr:choice-of-anchor D domain-containing protein [Acidobacteriaceae bacterium]
MQGSKALPTSGRSPGRWTVCFRLLLTITLLIPFAVAADPSAAWAQQQQLLPPTRPTTRRPPDGRRTALFLARRQPHTGVPAILLLRARAAHAALVRAQSSIQPPYTVWQPVGPSQVSTVPWNVVTGQVTSLAADPSDTTGNTLYAGTAGGGVWKSTNAAGAPASVTFTPLTDTLSAWSSAVLTSLSIGTVSVQPGGTGVVLAGTGDPNSGSGSWYGAGILRSTNNGSTWNLISYAAPDPVGLTYNFIGGAMSGFAWSSANPNLVVVAVADPGNQTTVIGAVNQETTYGLYSSQDAGATWQLATIEDGSQVIEGDEYSNGGGNSATAIAWNPIRRRFYAAIRYHGYYESTDGVTFTRLTHQPGVNLTTGQCPTRPGTSGSHACPIYRGALAAQPATGDMFAWTVDSHNLDQGLWQDTCHAGSSGCASPTVSFATQISDSLLQSPSGSGTLGQADYDFTLAAVPSQQDTLLFAGTVDLWKCSLANSCVWRNTTNTQTCAAAQVAPAQHAIESTFGSTGLLYFGNDAGLWRSTDAVHQKNTPCTGDDAKHFQNLNAGLGSLAAVESFTEDPSNPTTWLAALGDLGTAAPTVGATTWNQVLDGEGDVVAIDPANSQNWYATSEAGVAINLCTQGTACDIADFGNTVIGESQVANDFQPIAAPWILDPQNTANLILGTCRVWRGAANGFGWSQLNLLSATLDKDQGDFCNGNAEIRTLAAIPITSGPSAGSEQIYVGMAGVVDGGGLIPGHLFTATVNSASQANNTQWLDRYSSPVTMPGAGGAKFNPGGYGISSIEPDPHDPTGRTIYVTVQGISSLTDYEPVVYQSKDAGAHWTVIGENLPAAPADSILVDPNNANVVYVALDTGVYITQNIATCSQLNQACWNVYGSGLPNAPPVSLMAYNEGDTQVLRVATWGRGIWQTDLATAGIAPTTATFQPATLMFPGQKVETASAAQGITVSNTGTLNLNITSVAVTGDFTETDTCTDQSLPLQGSCQVSVTFNPSQNGSRSGLLTLFGNVSGGQITAALSGTGLAPAVVFLTPSSLTFGATMVGSKSAAQFMTIANTGDIATTLTSETVSGDFSISTNTCTGSLAANSSCTLGVVFAPSASGARTGVLTVADALGTQTAPLSGIGQNPATDALAPLSLTFAAQQVGTNSTAQQVTLTNTGDQPLTSIAVGATGDFAAVNNCGATLQGKAACSVSVTYVPTITGAESGTLTVTDEFRTQKVVLGGTGIAPPGASALPTTINFGGYAVGTTSSLQTVTVTNSGGYDLTGLTVVISSGFAVATNNCSSTLAVGTSCQIGVTFTPAAAGSTGGTLIVSATNLPQALTVTLSGAGQDFSVAVTGSSSITITSGQTATFALQLGGLGGTTGTVALACSGAPQYSTCSLNPASIAVGAQNTSSVTATIVTGVSTTAAAAHPNWRTILPVLSLVLPLWFGRVRRKNARRLSILLLASIALVAGCGVGSS